MIIIIQILHVYMHIHRTPTANLFQRKSETNIWGEVEYSAPPTHEINCLLPKKETECYGR